MVIRKFYRCNNSSLNIPATTAGKLCAKFGGLPRVGYERCIVWKEAKWLVKRDSVFDTDYQILPYNWNLRKV